MDFILPASLPACGIPWEKVLPPLLPRLNAAYGAQCGWNQLVTPRSTAGEPRPPYSAQVDCDSGGFTVQVDVKLFRPEELLVKVTGDFVEVQGKHQETKRDGPGVITRQFSRRYRIPEGVDSLALESAVSPEGVLVISAPLQQQQQQRAARDCCTPAPPTPRPTAAGHADDGAAAAFSAASPRSHPDAATASVSRLQTS